MLQCFLPAKENHAGRSIIVKIPLHISVKSFRNVI